MADPRVPPGFLLDAAQIDALFASFFPRGPAVAPSPDVETTLVVPARVASEGGWQEISIGRLVRCAACGKGGSYRDAGGCGTCDGSGKVEHAGAPVGFTSACPECGGQGQRAARACDRCTGGVVATSERLRVRVPEGTPPGQRMRVAGKGHDRVGGSPGDLYVEVLVEGVSSGVGPLRVPLATVEALPERCFACAERREVARVTVGVRPRLDRSKGVVGLLAAVLGGFGFATYEAATVELPLCRRHLARFEERTGLRRWIGVFALLAAAGLVVEVLLQVLRWGVIPALAGVVAVTAAALVAARAALRVADAGDPFRVWLDEDSRELVLPPLRSDRAE